VASIFQASSLYFPDVPPSVSPEVAEPGESQLRVPNRVVDIAMTEVQLDCAGILAVVGELEPASVSQHVWVYRKG
jgi:hypothetical protein